MANVDRDRVLWHTLKQRCRTRGFIFDERFSVYEDFLSWCKNQIGYNLKDINGNFYVCETDLLSDGCKRYSPETILFVPKSVNQLCIPKKKKGGVQFMYGKTKPYRAYINKFGKSVHLGYFYNMEDAMEVSNKARVDYINELEVMYNGTVDKCVWVEIRKPKWNILDDIP